jgi:hypothetical protein
MLKFKKYKYFYSAIALFFIFTQTLFAQNKSGISDSLLQTLPQYHTKGLLKIHWLVNSRNSPWYIPNGAVYEGTWGKKTTYDIGTSFRTLSHLQGYYEIAAYVGASYYFRKAKNNYTFKGFFVRTGLAYSTVQDVMYNNHSYGLLTGFGYQNTLYRRWYFEISYATLFGRYEVESYFDSRFNKNRWDAFKWNDIAIRLGYRLF